MRQCRVRWPTGCVKLEVVDMTVLPCGPATPPLLSLITCDVSPCSRLGHHVNTGRLPMPPNDRSTGRRRPTQLCSQGRLLGPSRATQNGRCRALRRLVSERSIARSVDCQHNSRLVTIYGSSFEGKQARSCLRTIGIRSRSLLVQASMAWRMSRRYGTLSYGQKMFTSL